MINYFQLGPPRFSAILKHLQCHVVGQNAPGLPLRPSQASGQASIHVTSLHLMLALILVRLCTLDYQNNFELIQIAVAEPEQTYTAPFLR